MKPLQDSMPSSVTETGFSLQCPMAGVYRFKDVWGVYSTLIVGEKQALLVDTGIGVCNLSGAVQAITSLPLTVVNTHGHCDHLGGNYQFRQVFLPEKDFEIAQKSVSKDIKRRMLTLVPSKDRPQCFDERAYLESTLEHTVPLPKDAVFDLGGEVVRILPLENHTHGSVGFLCERRRLLLTGDAVAPYTWLYLPESCSLREHIAVLKRLMEDPRFDAMLCGHSDERMDKNSLRLFMACAQHAAETGKGSKFVDPISPQYTGKTYVELSDQGQAQCALIAFDPKKEAAGH